MICRGKTAVGRRLFFYIVLVVINVPGMVLAKGIELTMNHQFPAATAGSHLDQWFADEIARRSGGDITIRIFWDNGLGEPRANLSMLRRGVVDMAAMSAGYFPEEMPLLAAPNSIPMALDNVCQSSTLMKRLLNEVPAVRREAEELGIHPLFFHVLNPYLLVSREPITDLAGLRGKRIRTWGNDLGPLFAAGGAIPVPLYLQDLYPAFAEKIIDGCPFSVDLTVAYKLYEEIGHITELVVWEGPSWGVWLSDAAWQNLTPAHRQLFRAVADEVRAREVRENLAASDTAWAELKAKGVQFHTFTDRDLEIWKARAPDFFHRFITTMEAAGKGAAAREMVAIWEDVREDVTCP